MAEHPASVAKPKNLMDDLFDEPIELGGFLLDTVRLEYSHADYNASILANEEGRWITLEGGQHVYIGAGGELMPHGPDAYGEGVGKGKALPPPREESRAKVVHDPDGDPEETEHVASQLFGPDWKMSDFANAVGAPHDATVTIGIDEENGGVRVKSVVMPAGPQGMRGLKPEYESARILEVYDGEKTCKNEYIIIRGERQSKGEGTKVFSSQVDFLASKGFASIECEAVRGPTANGYYTWPRLGYDMSLKDEPAGKAAKEKFGAETILDLMSTPQGRDWWKTNGDTLFGAKFDLKPGSRSRQILEDYQKERSARKETK